MSDERERPQVGLDLPRCPYCHQGVRAGADEAKQSCGACMAWHHAECWQDHGGCSACNLRDTESTRAPAVNQRPTERVEATKQKDTGKTSLPDPEAPPTSRTPPRTGLAAVGLLFGLGLIGFGLVSRSRRPPPPSAEAQASWQQDLLAATSEAEKTSAFRAGAEAGSPGAMNQYGFRLLNGIGCAPDPEAAVGWARRAAEAGHGEAMYGLALCYEQGVGVAADPAQAVAWYRKAVAAGDTLAGPRLEDLLRRRPDLR